MEKNIDRTFNELSEKMDKFRNAEIEGNKKLMEAYEKDVLTLSCRLLHDLLGLLRDHRQEIDKNNKSLSDLRRDPAMMKEFLDLEDRLLKEAGILPQIAESIKSLIVEVVNTEGKTAANPENNWEIKLNWLIDEVCPQAKKKAKRLKRKPLWKKIRAAAGGGILVLVDLPVVPKIPVAGYSILAGIEIIKKAGESAADDFIDE